MTFKVKGGIQIGANTAVDANAMLQQIELAPTTRPSLLFDFVNSKTVDSRATFTRNTRATFVDEDGWIKTANPNVPRFEYSSDGLGTPRGLSLENTKTNLISSSGNFFGSTWTSSNTVVVPNVGIAPDGTFTATKVYDTADATGTYHLLSSASTGILTATQYTFSIFVKAAELTFIALYPISGGNGATFNLSTGTAAFIDTGITAAVEPFKDGWYRLSTSITSSGTTASPRIYLYNGATNYTGDGLKGVLVWGAQFEEFANYTTSFFPSNTTFTSRSSNATYRDNTDGLLKFASSNVVRYHYNPQTRTAADIFVEPTSTNLQPYGDQLGSWGATGATATNNVAAAPTGTTVAASITEDTNNSRHYIGATSVGSIVANTFVTGSVYLKAGTRTKAYVWVGIPGSPYTRAGCIVDLTTGAAVTNNVGTPLNSSFTIEDYGTGWYRVVVTGRIDTTSTMMYMEIGGADNTNATTYTGTGSTFYLWGAQVENTRYATSYIPTPGNATATRAADVYSTTTTTRDSDNITMPISSSVFKPYEGTVACEVEICGDLTTNQYIWGLGTGGTEALISQRIIGGALQFVLYNNGSSQGTANFKDPFSANAMVKTAVSYTNTNWTSAYSGSITEGIGPGAIPAYGNLTLRGGYGSGVRKAYMKSFVYYPTKLSNTELQVITSS